MLNPLLYLFYGLIYIVLLDTFIRYRENRWYVWYLGGLLLGLLIETYIAKVVFFGLTPNETRVWGLAPGPILFVVFWYHPLFSFMVPAWIAAHLAGFPLPIPDSRDLRWLAWLGPLLLLPANLTVVMQRCGTPFIAGVLLILSGLVVALWMRCFRQGGAVATILLSDTERRRMWWCFAGMLLFGLVIGTNHDHGRSALDFPLVPMLGMTAGIAALALLIRAVVRQNGPQTGAVPFDPALPPPTSHGTWHRWLVWFCGFHTLMLGFYVPLAPLREAGIPGLATIGVFWGCGLLAVAIFKAIRGLGHSRRQEP